MSIPRLVKPILCPECGSEVFACLCEDMSTDDDFKINKTPPKGPDDGRWDAD